MGRKMLFVVGSVLVSAILLEVGTTLIHWAVTGEAFPSSRWKSTLISRADDDGVTLGLADPPDQGTLDVTRALALHPFVGYTWDLGHPEIQSYSNNLFLGVPADWLGRSDDRLIVGLFGGSFAAQLAGYTEELISSELELVLGKRIEFVNFALGGCKQPQQLMTLCYLFALGAEFDIVINIDGFNEVALPPAENVQSGLFPLYPRIWKSRLSSVAEPTTLGSIYRIQELNRKRIGWARVFARTPLHLSNTLMLMWRFRDAWLEREEHELESRIKEAQAADARYEVTGPTTPFSDEKSLYELLSTNWKLSSIQMDALCEANGVDYFHFLQPNQYVEGSKPMTSREMAIAIRTDHPYREGVVIGYPLLKRMGRELTEHGVKFLDLTDIFSAREELFYADDCCHLNSAGYEIVAREVIDSLTVDR